MKKLSAIPAIPMTLMLLTVTSPAFAQFERAKTALSAVQTGLLSLGGIVITIATMFVGFRMLFQAAQWKDVAPVFWGGVLIGAASTVATMLIN